MPVREAPFEEQRERNRRMGCNQGNGGRGGTIRAVETRRIVKMKVPEAADACSESVGPASTGGAPGVSVRG